MEFLIHREGKDLGPYSESEVRNRLIAGVITLSDLAWREGATEWAPLSSFDQFATSYRQRPAPPPPIPAPESQALPPPLAAESLGPYTAATLQPDERPLHKTTIHWIVIGGALIWSILLLVVVVPIALIAAWKGYSWLWALLLFPAGALLSAVITVKTSELVITDRRVLIKVGVIQRRTFEIFISKIESVAVHQSMFGRVFDYGTVTIRGTGGSAESFSTITTPLAFRDAIQRVQSASEKQR